MKDLTFTKEGVIHEPLKYWVLKDGTKISIYQGNRGANPDLDFIIKYREVNKRLRAPSHTHWIVDLLMKSEKSKVDVKNFIDKWLTKYEEIQPFSNINERNNYELLYVSDFVDEFIDMNSGTYTVEFLSAIIELFIRCEKQTPGAFMFKSLMQTIKDFCEDKKDWYQVVSISKRV
jgi:hypothetical protein